MASASKTTATNTVDSLFNQFKKDSGEDIGSYGGELVNAPRLPTGLFTLDLALGGGFPRGKCHEIFGPESSCKTNIALMAIAANQRMYPDERCAFIDVEHAFNPTWAAKLGVDVDNLLVLSPPYAEKLVDQVEALMHADDIGVIVVDSIAAMMTMQEMDSSAEKANVGGSGLAVGKLCRKITAAQAEMDKRDKFPTVFLINQIRFKIGVMFGDPETTPGGNAPKFTCNMRLRVYGKNVKDPKISADMPVMKEVSFIMKKWKSPIISASGKIDMVMVEHKGLKPGQTDDFNTISEHLKELGHFENNPKKGWVILGEEYAKIADFKDRIYGDVAYGDEVRKALIDYFREQNGISADE